MTTDQMTTDQILVQYRAARHRLRVAAGERERAMHDLNVAESAVKDADRDQAALWARFVEAMNTEINAHDAPT